MRVATVVLTGGERVQLPVVSPGMWSSRTTAQREFLRRLHLLGRSCATSGSQNRMAQGLRLLGLVKAVRECRTCYRLTRDGAELVQIFVPLPSVNAEKAR